MAEVFGFDKAAKMFDEIASKADEGRKTTEEYQEKMMNLARRNFQAGLTQRTGKGAAGIQKETSGDHYDIGWSGRPGMHGYFHELGFHALDNRRKGIRHKKLGGTNRHGGYRGRTATYVPATPHMRPAYYELKDQYTKEAQRRLVP
ncbi:hypothetical protein [Facklamia sp. P12950]|uniref:hypothetical protein n=1 Tax=Facklamia sp. P12950 TaxID=3421951 RepID=UPI003D184B82